MKIWSGCSGQKGLLILQTMQFYNMSWVPEEILVKVYGGIEPQIDAISKKDILTSILGLKQQKPTIKKST